MRRCSCGRARRSRLDCHCRQLDLVRLDGQTVDAVLRDDDFDQGALTGAIAPWDSDDQRNNLVKAGFVCSSPPQTQSSDYLSLHALGRPCRTQDRTEGSPCSKLWPG